MTDRRKWVVLFTCFIAYTFDAMELVALTVALPSIRHDLDLTDVQGGWLATATLLGIGVSTVVSGWIADNLGRKPALIAALLVFGVFTAALAPVSNYWLFLVIRFLAGFGLGGVWSAVSTFVVEAWPAQQRARAAAFVIAAFPAGGVLASLAGAALLPHWRIMFLILGVAVVVPVLIVWRTIGESQAWQQERRAEGAARARASVSLRDVFTPALIRTTLIGTAVVALSQIGFWGVNTWLPTFLSHDRGIDVRTVALLVALNNAAMFVGYNVFGFVADKIGHKRGIILTLVAAGVMLPIYVLTHSQSLLVWIGPLFAFFASFGALFGSYLGELFPTRVRATGAGFCFNVGRGVSAFAPLALGALSASYGTPFALIVTSGFFFLSALTLTAMPRRSAGTATAAPELEVAMD